MNEVKCAPVGKCSFRHGVLIDVIFANYINKIFSFAGVFLKYVNCLNNIIKGKLHFAPMHFIQNLTLIHTRQIVILNPSTFGQVLHWPFCL